MKSTKCVNYFISSILYGEKKSSVKSLVSRKGRKFMRITHFCFREKYGENLPSNWQELVENCPRIIKDRVVNGLLVLLPNNEVRRM